MSPLIAVDLFSGVGGMSRGLTSSGFDVVGAVEIDELAAVSYAENFPHCTLVRDDIRALTTRNFAKRTGVRKGELDLLAACPPCEGFSSIRTLNGHSPIRDPRNDLVLEITRFVAAFLPRVVLVENVPALASDRRAAQLVLQLERLGYMTRAEVVDAADFGVPQRRRRFLLMASRIGQLPERPRKRRRTTVRDWIGGLSEAGFSGDPLHDHGETRSRKVMSLIRRIPKDGGSRRDLPEEMQLDCHLKCTGFKDVYGRMAWDDVAPTITGGCVNPSKGRFLHPSEHRAITVREAALLQSFPKGHVVSMDQGKFAAAELIGNALPPALVKAQALPIRHLLGFR